MGCCYVMVCCGVLLCNGMLWGAAMWWYVMGCCYVMVCYGVLLCDGMLWECCYVMVCYDHFFVWQSQVLTWGVERQTLARLLHQMFVFAVWQTQLYRWCIFGVFNTAACLMFIGAVHRNIISVVKPTRCTNVSNVFYFKWHSTCFGRSFRPSSAVQDCTYSNRHLPHR